MGIGGIAEVRFKGRGTTANIVIGSFLAGGSLAGLVAYFLADALGVRGKILE